MGASDRGSRDKRGSEDLPGATSRRGRAPGTSARCPMTSPAPSTIPSHGSSSGWAISPRPSMSSAPAPSAPPERRREAPRSARLDAALAEITSRQRALDEAPPATVARRGDAAPERQQETAPKRPARPLAADEPVTRGPRGRRAPPSATGGCRWPRRRGLILRACATASPAAPRPTTWPSWSASCRAWRPTWPAPPLARRRHGPPPRSRQAGPSSSHRRAGRGSRATGPSPAARTPSHGARG